ncbi:MAG: FAD binding domain-containing protein [Planctomycetes bacterium]|nr:FAD binding domain-containing protein [Planctomycetota bacterium]
MIREFHRPVTLRDALELKARLGGGARYLAGGTELNAISARAAEFTAIALDGLGLGAVAEGADGVDGLRLGPTLTLQELIDAPAVPPALREAAAHVANRNIRNGATLGGNLAARRACAALVPVLLALEADLLLCDATGERRLPLADFRRERPDALITAILLPAAARARRVGLRRFARTANGPTLLSVAVSCLGAPDARVQSPIVAVAGVAADSLRLTGVERRLQGHALPVRAVLEGWVREAVAPAADPFASAELKRHLAAVLVADCLARAAQRED